MSQAKMVANCYVNIQPANGRPFVTSDIMELLAPLDGYAVIVCPIEEAPKHAASAVAWAHRGPKPSQRARPGFMRRLFGFSGDR